MTEPTNPDKETTPAVSSVDQSEGSTKSAKSKISEPKTIEEEIIRSAKEEKSHLKQMNRLLNAMIEEFKMSEGCIEKKTSNLDEMFKKVEKLLTKEALTLDEFLNCFEDSKMENWKLWKTAPKVVREFFSLLSLALKQVPSGLFSSKGVGKYTASKGSIGSEISHGLDYLQAAPGLAQSAMDLGVQVPRLIFIDQAVRITNKIKKTINEGELTEEKTKEYRKIVERRRKWEIEQKAGLMDSIATNPARIVGSGLQLTGAISETVTKFGGPGLAIGRYFPIVGNSIKSFLCLYVLVKDIVGAVGFESFATKVREIGTETNLKGFNIEAFKVHTEKQKEVELKQGLCTLGEHGREALHKVMGRKIWLERLDNTIGIGRSALGVGLAVAGLILGIVALVCPYTMPVIVPIGIALFFVGLFSMAGGRLYSFLRKPNATLASLKKIVTFEFVTKWHKSLAKVGKDLTLMRKQMNLKKYKEQTLARYVRLKQLKKVLEKDEKLTKENEKFLKKIEKIESKKGQKKEGPEAVQSYLNRLIEESEKRFEAMSKKVAEAEEKVKKLQKWMDNYNEEIQTGKYKDLEIILGGKTAEAMKDIVNGMAESVVTGDLSVDTNDYIKQVFGKDMKTYLTVERKKIRKELEKEYSKVALEDVVDKKLQKRVKKGIKEMLVAGTADQIRKRNIEWVTGILYPSTR